MSWCGLGRVLLSWRHPSHVVVVVVALVVVLDVQLVDSSSFEELIEHNELLRRT